MQIHRSTFPPHPPFPGSSPSGGPEASWPPPGAAPGAFNTSAVGPFIPPEDSFGAGDIPPPGGRGSGGGGSFIPDDPPFIPDDPFAGAPAVPPQQSEGSMRAKAMALLLLAFLLLIASFVLVIVGNQSMSLSLASFGAGLLSLAMAEAGDAIERRRRNSKGLPGGLGAAFLVSLAAVAVSVAAAWRVADIAAI